MKRNLLHKYILKSLRFKYGWIFCTRIFILRKNYYTCRTVTKNNERFSKKTEKVLLS